VCTSAGHIDKYGVIEYILLPCLLLLLLVLSLLAYCLFSYFYKVLSLFLPLQGDTCVFDRLNQCDIRLSEIFFWPVESFHVAVYVAACGAVVSCSSVVVTVCANYATSAHSTHAHTFK